MMRTKPMFSLSINTISHLIAPSLRPAQYSPFSHSPSFSSFVEESYALTVRALLEAASVLNLLRKEEVNSRSTFCLCVTS